MAFAAASEPSRKNAAAPANHDEISRRCLVHGDAVAEPLVDGLDLLGGLRLVRDAACRLRDGGERRRVGRHGELAAAAPAEAETELVFVRARRSSCRARSCTRGSPRPSQAARPAAVRACRASARRRRAARSPPGMWPFFPRGAFRPTDESTVFTASLQPVADRSPGLRLEQVDALTHDPAVGRRRHEQLRRRRERHEPDTDCLGTRSRNANIASCAAPSRVGFTSSARIEPETSTRSTIVARDVAVDTSAFGRPSAVDANASASRNSASGTQRRHVERRSTATDASTSMFVNATA